MVFSKVNLVVSCGFVDDRFSWRRKLQLTEAVHRRKEKQWVHTIELREKYRMAVQNHCSASSSSCIVVKISVSSTPILEAVFAYLSGMICLLLSMCVHNNDNLGYLFRCILKNMALDFLTT